MAGVRFEDVDLLGALSRIVDLHTQHYKEDFDLDKELISKLAVSERSEDKQLLWMSRPCGTYTLREREVYLEGSHENKVWRFYQEQTNDPVLAYAISLKEVRDGKIFGDLYPLNYREHVERMKKLTCPIGNVAVAFEDGNVITIPYQERRQFMNRLMPEHGAPKTMTYLPENEPELMIILKRERLKRSYHATAGNLEEYGLILANHLETLTEFTHEELIVCKALENATDYDLKNFKEIMENYLKPTSNGRRIVFPKDFADIAAFTTTCDWCVYNRIFVSRTAEWGEMEEGILDMSTYYYEANPASVLLDNINAARQTWNYG